MAGDRLNDQRLRRSSATAVAGEIVGTLQFVGRLSLWIGLALATLEVIDPRIVKPFVEPGWFLGAGTALLIIQLIVSTARTDIAVHTD